MSVSEFSESESIKFLRIVIEAHSVSELKVLDNDRLKFFALRLGYKPLLLKWFVLGVKSGLDPNRIVADSKIALQFCLENVIDKLGSAAKFVAVILAAIPEAISVSVLQEISDRDAFYVEEGIAELSRFGLLTSEDMSGVDRHFKLRTFVRSYIIRVINPDNSYTRQISLEYKKVNDDFERERLQVQGNRYSIRHLTVRSRSEAVAAKKLKNALRVSASQGWVDESLFAELKITNPAYFEIYRIEAIAAFHSSDIPRAIQSYEAALEYGSDQPQLHYFFAGLLMRSGYTDRAAVEYERALEIDPNEPCVLREAARNLFRLHKFDEAKAYLNRAACQRARTQKDLVVLLDLQIQARVREMEQNANTGDLDRTAEGAADLLAFLESCDTRLFDRTIYEHIRDVSFALAIVRRDSRRGTQEIDALSAWIQKNAPFSSQFGTPGSGKGLRLGTLKLLGRKPTFGFIVDSDQNEFFVAAATIAPLMWKWLNEDGAVFFEEATSEKGRIAINIEKYQTAE